MDEKPSTILTRDEPCFMWSSNKDIDAVRQCVLERVLAGVRQDQLWLGHQIKVVDVQVLMADTSENQAERTAAGMWFSCHADSGLLLHG